MEAQTAVERVEQLQRERIEKGLCGCPCGEPRIGLSGQSLYLNERHKQRAYRERVNAAAEASGVPASLTLKAARGSTPTRRGNGDAQKAATRREKRSPELRVSYLKLAAAIDALGPDASVEDMRAAIDGLLTAKQRAALDARDG
jgi:hypothetical protein